MWGDGVRRRTAPHRAPATLPGNFAGDFSFTLPAFPRGKGRSGGQKGVALSCSWRGGSASCLSDAWDALYIVLWMLARPLTAQAQVWAEISKPWSWGKKIKSYRTLWLPFMIY